MPCAYWLRQTQLNLVGLILIGCARLSRSYIQIKNFLNSYRAGAHSNLVTLDVSTLFSVGVQRTVIMLIWYTHKTSGFKTSGFKTSGFKTSETSGLQNVSFTKRQVYKTSGRQNVRSSKRPFAKKTSLYILYLWLVEIRRFCCSHVCRLGFILYFRGFFAIYHNNR